MLIFQLRGSLSLTQLQVWIQWKTKPLCTARSLGGRTLSGPRLPGARSHRGALDTWPQDLQRPGGALALPLSQLTSLCPQLVLLIHKPGEVPSVGAAKVPTPICSPEGFAAPLASVPQPEP